MRSVRVAGKGGDGLQARAHRRGDIEDGGRGNLVGRAVERARILSGARRRRGGSGDGETGVVVTGRDDDIIQVPQHREAGGIDEAPESRDVAQRALAHGIFLEGKLVMQVEFEIARVDVEAQFGVGRDQDVVGAELGVREVFGKAERGVKAEDVELRHRPGRVDAERRAEDDVGFDRRVLAVGQVHIVHKLGAQRGAEPEEHGADLDVAVRGDGRHDFLPGEGRAGFLLRLRRRGPDRAQNEEAGGNFIHEGCGMDEAGRGGGKNAPSRGPFFPKGAAQ